MPSSMILTTHVCIAIPSMHSVGNLFHI
ncbi:hypothetical protein CORC01_04360 [Colletotrichum orchidophilum]|uniref:Uncharacterized protein n=1 Tax=Colletotrichum orchidophilum TaxID=1209926 RepID=A0A1G4BG72_9PEZI|nr:hypothetical protein CORC01_04360 [Colletotrichum orchidophilum]